MQTPSEQLHKAGVLYVMATPIGHYSDISQRALDILQVADYIAAEDTRVTGLLLKHYGIQTKFFSLREHNEQQVSQKIITLLQQGHTIVQVSDAGTPAISDPGMILVNAVRQAGYQALPIPGACAAVSAFSVSGIIAAHFLFYGFLPAKTQARQAVLQQNQLLDETAIIYYEAPHRIVESLKDIAQVYGGTHTVFFAREMTKTYETYRLGCVAELLDWVQVDANQTKGEIVLVLAPMSVSIEADLSATELEVLSYLLLSMPLRQAVQLLVSLTGLPKNKVYETALTLKNSQA